MAEELAVYIKEWKCISERMVLVRLKIREEWVCIVQVYAPTENGTVEEKEEFLVPCRGQCQAYNERIE